jgi:hypothetical protein
MKKTYQKDVKDLIQLSVWLFDTPEERAVLDNMYKQVIKNKGRKAMIVYNNYGNRIALFVNNVSNKFKYGKFE